MTEIALELDKLNKIYKGGFHAVKDVSFTIEQGDFFAFLGANGAGKSTTISMISSITRITSGQIKIMGHDLIDNPTCAKCVMGIVPQEVNLDPMEQCEQILFDQAGLYGVSPKKAAPRIKMLLKEMVLWDKRKSRVRALSGGMKRRLMVARALVHNPKILLLDEPTAGVDVEIRKSLWKFLAHENKKGLTILLTTHYLEEAEELCNRVAVIHHGEIVETCSMEKLLAQDGKLEKHFLDLIGQGESS